MPYIIALAVVAAAALGAVIWAIGTSNKFKAMLVKIREADSGIDVALTKRFDTLTKLMDVVKAYAKHEASLITETIKLRAGMGVEEKVEANRQMDAAMRQLNVVAEAYPALRSSENYKQLQEAIAETEDHLQGARRVYNSNISVFNQAIARFPASIIAGSRYTSQPFFEAEAGKRDDVKISL
jgi:LemA protein